MMITACGKLTGEIFVLNGKVCFIPCCVCYACNLDILWRAKSDVMTTSWNSALGTDHAQLTIYSQISKKIVFTDTLDTIVKVRIRCRVVFINEHTFTLSSCKSQLLRSFLGKTICVN